MSIFSKLPFDIIKEILLYNNNFIMRRNRIVFINKIPKDDLRFLLYNKIPKIYEISHNNWSVILETNNHKKYIIGHYLRPSLIWEYKYSVFSRDPHTNMMRLIPDYMICIPFRKLNLDLD